MNLTSTEFQNAYEKLYNEIRKYLWPYSVLEQLAEVEVDIYSRFINMDKLSIDYGKLKSSIKDVCKDDVELQKCCRKIENMINSDDPVVYAKLLKPQEVNPDQPKIFKPSEDTK